MTLFSIDAGAVLSGIGRPWTGSGDRAAFDRALAAQSGGPGERPAAFAAVGEPPRGRKAPEDVDASPMTDGMETRYRPILDDVQFVAPDTADSEPDPDPGAGPDSIASENDPSADSVHTGMGDSSFENSHGNAHRDARDFLRETLALHIDDGAISPYGTVAMLVLGRLVEVDLFFIHRADSLDGNMPPRRLVMSLDTHLSGRIRIVAQALNDRLTIAFSGQTEPDAATLAAYAAEVRELGKRLGWIVQAMSYRFNSQLPEATL